MKTRIASGLPAILAVALLGGIGLLGVRLRFYWVAKYRGRAADLHGVALARAPLAGANLRSADLKSSILTGANLRGAWLNSAELTQARLSDASLQGAYLV